MILESMEQRVANTPVALLCDECLKKDCCKWVEGMRTAVVNTDKVCHDRPFKPEAWTCQLYLEEGSTKHYSTGRYVWDKPDYMSTAVSNYIPTEDSPRMIKGGG